MVNQLSNALGKLTPEDTQAIIETSNRLGIRPDDLTSIMLFESAGTMNPDIWGGGTKYGIPRNYVGLIQLGPSERLQYGYKPGMSIAEQVRGPVYNFLSSRGVKPGMDLSQVYNKINPGGGIFTHQIANYFRPVVQQTLPNLSIAGVSNRPSTTLAQAGLTPDQYSALTNPYDPSTAQAARTPDFSAAGSPDYSPPAPPVATPPVATPPLTAGANPLSVEQAIAQNGSWNVAPRGDLYPPNSLYPKISQADFFTGPPDPYTQAQIGSPSAVAARAPANISSSMPSPINQRNINFNNQRPAIKGDDVAFVQEQLKSSLDSTGKSYYTGKVDGIGGPMTRDAFARYQQDHPGTGTSIFNTMNPRNNVPDAIYGPRSQRSLDVVRGTDLPNISPAPFSPRVGWPGAGSIDYTPPPMIDTKVPSHIATSPVYQAARSDRGLTPMDRALQAVAEGMGIIPETSRSFFNPSGSGGHSIVSDFVHSSSDTGGPGNRTTSGPGTNGSASSGNGRTTSGPGISSPSHSYSSSDTGYSGNNPTGYISQATSTPSALYQSPNTYQDYNPGYSDYSNIGGIP
jgi:hypothetical protein